MRITLSQYQISELMKQDPATKSEGGFQGLLVSLQEKLNTQTGEITLSPQDLERIPRYAFDYGNGGWEDTLQGIFGSHLGPNLGRG